MGIILQGGGEVGQPTGGELGIGQVRGGVRVTEGEELCKGGVQGVRVVLRKGQREGGAG